MERQLAPLLAAGQLQLARHRLFVDADAHGGDLKRTFQHRVPHQNVAVQRPVVIVRRAAVVRLAGFQLAADLHQEDRVVLAQDGVFALLRRLVGVHVLQLLRRDEEDLAVELRMQARERNAERIVRLADGADDVAHGALQIRLVPVLGHLDRLVNPTDGLLQERDGALLARNDLFPVPLVDVNRVEVVHLFVAPDGVHIGEQALADVELVALERQPLPLGKRMDDLRVDADIGNVERDGPLDAVEVVIEAGFFIDKQRCGHTAQIERIAQIHLKIALDELDCPLQLINAERSMLVLRNGQLAHMTNLTFFTFSGKSPEIIRYIIRDWPGLCKRE